MQFIGLLRLWGFSLSTLYTHVLTHTPGSSQHDTFMSRTPGNSQLRGLRTCVHVRPNTIEMLWNGTALSLKRELLSVEVQQSLSPIVHHSVMCGSRLLN